MLAPRPLTPDQTQVYEQLKQVRASTTVALKPTPLLRQKIEGPDGEEVDLVLRYYQVQAVVHMLRLRRMVLGDDTGLGKTVETISTLCYMWQLEPNTRVIVLAPKSAMRQWASEIRRFTTGVKVFLANEGVGVKGEPPVEARRRVYEAWLAAPVSEHPILIMNYSLLARDWNHGALQPPLPSGKLPKKAVKPGLLNEITSKAGTIALVADEATAFKTMSTKTWETVRFLADKCHRVYGLTATLLKNNLMEGYCIYKAIKPDLFDTKTAFIEDYCVTKLQSSGKKKIPIVIGYRNLAHFRDSIDPFFLGRKKHMVAKDLPVLTTKEVCFEMDLAEDTKYDEALEGVLLLGDGDVREYKEHAALVSLIYCQQICDSLTLLKFQEGSEIGNGQVVMNPGTLDLVEDSIKVGALGSKEQALLDLFDGGELEDEKVIIYTRFESVVARLQAILAKAGVKNVRVTGKQNDKAREAAQKAFQDLNSDTKVVFITDAGSEAINLQAASATVFFDAPWSWGTYLQILGRMIRIGSIHRGVLAIHLVAERGPQYRDKKTIDHHVLTLLRRKRNMIDQVLGEGAVGALKFARGGDGSGAKSLVKLLQGKKLPKPKALPTGLEEDDD